MIYQFVGTHHAAAPLPREDALFEGKPVTATPPRGGVFWHGPPTKLIYMMPIFVDAVLDLAKNHS